ncbi:Uncharacterized protein APZ42_000740, partial [Daphnia magna]
AFSLLRFLVKSQLWLKALDSYSKLDGDHENQVHFQVTLVVLTVGPSNEILTCSNSNQNLKQISLR